MAVTTNGAEFKRFYSDKEFWPDDEGHTWHEDVLFKVDGEPVPDDFDMSNVADTAKVSMEDGIVFSPKFEGNEPSFETYFKRWRKQQTSTTLVVEVDLAKLDAVKAAIRAAGGKVS